MNVLFGFLIIALIATPICLLWDRFKRTKKYDLFTTLLHGKKNIPYINKSGQINITEGLIKYKSEIYGQWEISVESLIMLGELTNSDGPYFDDWFIWFLTKDKKWFTASHYADGTETIIKELEYALNTKISEKLVSSTTFNTNILWPEKYAGDPIIILSREKRNTFWGKIFRLYDVKESYSDPVQTVMDRFEISENT